MSTKLSKASVRYRGAEGGRKRCSNCSMFRMRTSDVGEPIDLCTLVEGHIRPQDLCDRYVARYIPKGAVLGPTTKRQ